MGELRAAVLAIADDAVGSQSFDLALVETEIAQNILVVESRIHPGAPN